MTAVGSGKATLSDKHFDKITKYEEDEALRASVGIIEFFGPNYPEGMERGDPVLARIQKKAFGTTKKEIILGQYMKPTLFLREPGEFKLEVFASNYSRNRGVVVQKGKRYEFNHKRELIVLETTQAIEPIKELLFSDTINDDALNIDYNNPELFKNIVSLEKTPLFKDNKNFVDRYFLPEERIVSSRNANGNHLKSHFNLIDVFNDGGKLDEVNNQKNEFDGFRIKGSDLIIFLLPAKV